MTKGMDGAVMSLLTFINQAIQEAERLKHDPRTTSSERHYQQGRADAMRVVRYILVDMEGVGTDGRVESDG